ncbi:uncharacterized protein VTP21DRAFT_4372 [Calcarisporiella thermophila]|uniref:uncharacterized protein n=1 Tax=Calcarisporiella thermophila TaxID=911321 RepID=UPI003743C116
MLGRFTALKSRLNQIKPQRTQLVQFSRRYSQAPWQEQKKVKTTSAIRERAAVGPFTWKALALFVTTGVGLMVYFKNEKERLHKMRLEEAKQTKSVGKPKVGGPFELIDHNGRTVTDRDFLGRFLLVYFGFTHCPDICPEELDKMSEAVTKINGDPKLGNVITPIFISCDPKRDTVEVVKEYVQDFHPDLIGLTGSYEAVAKAAKAYRVYFSTPKDLEEGEDYLVDHSIFFYLMGPDGKFVDCYGRESNVEGVVSSVKRYIEEYLESGKEIKRNI